MCVCRVKTNLARICICLYKYLRCCVCASDRQRYIEGESKHIAMWGSSARLWQQICVRHLKCLPTVCHCVCVCMRQQQLVQIFAKLMLYFIIRFSNLIPQKNKEINHVEIANNIEEVQPGSLSGELLAEN